jgi:hypothetical protein
MDLQQARITAHRNNIVRYRRLLTTPLTDLEQAFIKRRLTEEGVQLQVLERDRSEATLALPA